MPVGGDPRGVLPDPDPPREPPDREAHRVGDAPQLCVNLPERTASNDEERCRDQPAGAEPESAATTRMIHLRMRAATTAKSASARRHRGWPTDCITLAVLVGAAGAAPGRPRPVTDKPGTIPAAFTERSYGPGQPATLVVWKRLPAFTVRLFRAGPEGSRTYRADVMTGVPVGVRCACAWNRRRESRSSSALRIARAACTSLA